MKSSPSTIGVHSLRSQQMINLMCGAYVTHIPKRYLLTRFSWSRAKWFDGPGTHRFVCIIVAEHEKCNTSACIRSLLCDNDTRRVIIINTAKWIDRKRWERDRISQSFPFILIWRSLRGGRWFWGYFSCCKWKKFLVRKCNWPPFNARLDLWSSDIPTEHDAHRFWLLQRWSMYKNTEMG